MKREWKPGDVATGMPASVADQDDQWRVFFYRDNDDDVVKYMWDDGSGDEAISAPSDLRPLAVIDPEAEIPEEWVDVFWEPYANQATTDGNVRAGLAALFAHIAAPPEPKPEEPTGDRATVRDRDGVLWTRDKRDDDLQSLWRNFRDAWSPWSDLDVPTDGVLWGGVE